MKRDYMKEALEAIKDGNWMVRTDDNGKSYNGFGWRRRGSWTIAPDWNDRPECGCGLHGQGKEASGFRGNGSRVTFCKTEGKRVTIHGDKIKVEKAMILLINKLPNGLKFNGNLSLQNSHLKSLPDNLSVGGSLYLRVTQIKDKDVPKHLREKVIR